MISRRGFASRGTFHAREWLATILPISLWFVSTLFLRGQIGKWNDDYLYTQRSPDTGAIESLVLIREVHFLRPLYRLIEPLLQTLLWQHVAVHHMMTAAVHGFATVMVWKLLLALGIARQPAAIGAIVFLLHPAGYEVALWNSAMPTAMATVIVVALLILATRPGERPRRWYLLAFPFGAFAAASLNEQPAAALAAIPFVYLATMRKGESRLRALAKSAPPTILAGAAGAIYVLMHWRLTPRIPPGQNGSSISLTQFPERAIELGGEVAQYLSLGEFAPGAMAVGWEVARSQLLWSSVLLLALCVGGWIWIRSHSVKGHEIVQPDRCGQPGWIILLGTVVFLVCWFPIVRIHYWMSPRLCYPPMIGLAIVVAGLAQAGMLFVRDTRWAYPSRIATGVCVLLLSGPTLLIWIGTQAAYQSRARQDEKELDAIHQLMPDPWPGSVFVPVSIRLPADRSHSWRYDTLFRGAFMSTWSARWSIRQRYGRADLSSGWCEWEGSGILSGDDEQAMVLSIGPVPWNKIIPFVIDERGEVVLVGQVRGPGFEIRPPQTAQALDSLGLAGVVHEIPR